MKKKILVIGSLNMDLSIQVHTIPAVGETVLGRGAVWRQGGKGANQACAIAKLDGQVKMLGSVGCDEFGDCQIKGLKDAGVDTSNLKRCTDLSTGTAIICVDECGNNSIVVNSGANQACTEAYLKENDQLFEWCDYVVLQMEIPFGSVLYAASRAKELGKEVLLNPAPVPERGLDGLTGLVDYLTPNETELARLSGGTGSGLEDVKRNAEKLIGRGAENIIVTLGGQGAMLVNRDGAAVFPARKVDAVDTTAAGDCFNGAFVTALAEGRTKEEAIKFAIYAASVAVMREGAQESLPRKEEFV